MEQSVTFCYGKAMNRVKLGGKYRRFYSRLKIQNADS